MGIKFVLMVNKQGQTRLAQYYEHFGIQEKNALEGEIIRKCLARNDNQCSFIEFRSYKCVYRRYASLFFIMGVDSDQVGIFPVVMLSSHMSSFKNELAMLEFIHCLVETLDKYFENVCELDIMFNIDRAHFLLDEMLLGGNVVETNKKHALKPLQLLDQSAKEDSK